MQTGHGSGRGWGRALGGVIWAGLGAAGLGLGWGPVVWGEEARVAPVEVEESILTTALAGNGSTPLWALGAPMVVREGETVWTSLSVTDGREAPYCNTHWELWRKVGEAGWERVRSGPAAMEREPCPLALLDAETLAVSIHPKVLAREVDRGGETSWYCRPEMAGFDPREPEGDVRWLAPVFPPGARFNQHSYRTMGVDAASGEMVLAVIEEDDFRVTWRERGGVWKPLPRMRMPIRACYPQVALRRRAAHFLGIGDIVEFREEWMAEKRRVLQQEWDYVFRRLFYAWTPDVAREGFRPAVEVDSVDDTAGWMFNCDLYLDREGRAHLLWVKRTVQYGFLRDKFFPGMPVTDSLEYARVEGGRVAQRRTLWADPVVYAAEEGKSHSWVRLARFQELEDGRLGVIYGRAGAGGDSGAGGLFALEIDPAGTGADGPAARLGVERAEDYGLFFTATPRGGSRPGNRVDLLGGRIENNEITVRYARFIWPE